MLESIPGINQYWAEG